MQPGKQGVAVAFGEGRVCDGLRLWMRRGARDCIDEEAAVPFPL